MPMKLNIILYINVDTFTEFNFDLFEQRRNQADIFYRTRFNSKNR